ncbi:MAG: GHKL domain-containing protein [Flavobacteriia bacterium]|nr:GHKL domain-containing protein [Flavobacteriia bacterium]
MEFNRFNLFLIIRLIFMLGNLVLMAFLISNGNFWFTSISLFILLLIQVYEIVHYVNRTNRELTKFLYAVKYEDYSVSFSDPRMGKSFTDLNVTFNEIIEKFKNARIEKESQFQLFKLILEKINVGIITVDEEGHIGILNKAAGTTLNSPQVAQWDRLKTRHPEFCKAVEELENGGRRLVPFEDLTGIKELSIDVNPVRLTGTTHYIIAFQDIKDEIEQKEIEAWHKLIRILTHEIMNSITPVTSLTETMRSLLKDDEGQQKAAKDLDDETVEDILLALNTIHRRSVGMLEFVNDYRKLTKIPAPSFELVKVCDMFEDIEALLKGELQKRGISFDMQCSNRNLAIRCDRKLIEQVLINLMTNSFAALRDVENPTIRVNADVSEKRIALNVSDNGSGIEKDKLQRIFIPFYSTKRDGTGIGLSLSKNIMKIHHGTITVTSTPDVETRFSLSFPNHGASNFSSASNVDISN